MKTLTIYKSAERMVLVYDNGTYTDTAMIEAGPYHANLGETLRVWKFYEALDRTDHYDFFQEEAALGLAGFNRVGAKIQWIEV